MGVDPFRNLASQPSKARLLPAFDPAEDSQGWSTGNPGSVRFQAPTLTLGASTLRTVSYRDRPACTPSPQQFFPAGACAPPQVDPHGTPLAESSRPWRLAGDAETRRSHRSSRRELHGGEHPGLGAVPAASGHQGHHFQSQNATVRTIGILLAAQPGGQWLGRDELGTAIAAALQRSPSFPCAAPAARQALRKSAGGLGSNRKLPLHSRPSSGPCLEGLAHSGAAFGICRSLRSKRRQQGAPPGNAALA